MRLLHLPNDLPPRPRAVLRIGFAGSRVLTPEAATRVDGTLAEVLPRIGRRLAALTPGAPVAAGSEPKIAAFFDARQPPLLRLVTGLCEGADSIAAQVLEHIEIPADRPRAGPWLDTELAAVLPFDLARYRDTREAGFRAEFDRQAERCAYIVTLDGRQERPQPDTLLASARRAKAYRAQSRLLLRHADLLIAAAEAQPLLTEFFDVADTPPRWRWGRHRGRRCRGLRERCWDGLKGRLARRCPAPVEPAASEPFDETRSPFSDTATAPASSTITTAGATAAPSCAATGWPWWPCCWRA